MQLEFQGQTFEMVPTTEPGKAAFTVRYYNRTRNIRGEVSGHDAERLAWLLDVQSKCCTEGRVADVLVPR